MKVYFCSFYTKLRFLLNSFAYATVIFEVADLGMQAVQLQGHHVSISPVA